MLAKNEVKKFLAIVIFILISCVTVTPIIFGKEMSMVQLNNSDVFISKGPPNNGTLYGYVTDNNTNPFVGARVMVSFHETFEEDYTDEDGYYHVTNIPICYCLKNASCYMPCYQQEWVMLAIVENTTYDFSLYYSNRPPGKPSIEGPKSKNTLSIKSDITTLVNYPPGTYNFTFTATDPDGDDIRFHINWGDGDSETTKFVHSGEDIIMSHTIIYPGNLLIRAYAEDICGLIGPEGTIDIPILKNSDHHFSNEINRGSLGDFFNFLLILAKLIQRIDN
jgi:hypothetical protein